jgi:hypothetical protein
MALGSVAQTSSQRTRPCRSRPCHVAQVFFLHAASETPIPQIAITLSGWDCNSCSSCFNGVAKIKTPLPPDTLRAQIVPLFEASGEVRTYAFPPVSLFYRRCHGQFFGNLWTWEVEDFVVGIEILGFGEATVAAGRCRAPVPRDDDSLFPRASKLRIHTRTQAQRIGRQWEYGCAQPRPGEKEGVVYSVERALATNTFFRRADWHELMGKNKQPGDFYIGRAAGFFWLLIFWIGE